jgi:hypothetical protein
MITTVDVNNCSPLPLLVVLALMVVAGVFASIGADHIRRGLLSTLDERALGRALLSDPKFRYTLAIRLVGVIAAVTGGMGIIAFAVGYLEPAYR